MRKKKQLTKEQLESLGKLYSNMLKHSIDTWDIAMKGFRLDSTEYNLICSSGKAIQRVYLRLYFYAADECNWSEEKMREIFTEQRNCSFN